jgi:hypothetical protein
MLVGHSVLPEGQGLRARVREAQALWAGPRVGGASRGRGLAWAGGASGGWVGVALRLGSLAGSLLDGRTLCGLSLGVVFVDLLYQVQDIPTLPLFPRVFILHGCDIFSNAKWKW